MQSIGRVAGAYFGIGLCFGAHDYYGALQENKMYVERFGFSEDECRVINRLGFVFSTTGWVWNFHDFVKYRPMPHTWEEMNPYERDVTEYAAKILKIVAEEDGWNQGLLGAWNSIAEKITGDKALVEEFERKNDIYMANRDVRLIWKKLGLVVRRKDE